MLIDWLTARVEYQHLDRETVKKLNTIGDRVVRYCPLSGDVRYETSAWDSVRSDSHQIACRAGSDAFWIQGSPARVIGDGDAVFSAGASSALDLVGCLHRIVQFVADQTATLLPIDPACWIVTRVDVTENMMLDSLPEVLAALEVLRSCNGGRYRVSQTAGDTVYWSNRSRLRSGKAYAKGPHLQYLMKKNRHYSGREYTPSELLAAEKILRLELSLKSQYFRERLDKQWHQLTASDLKSEWNDYFLRMIGEAEIMNDDDLKTRIFQVASTEGRARAAYGCWLHIQHEGWERARECYPRSSWYKMLKILRSAGLSDSDLSAGRVVELRRKVLEARTVNDWQTLLAA